MLVFSLHRLFKCDENVAKQLQIQCQILTTNDSDARKNIYFLVYIFLSIFFIFLTARNVYCCKEKNILGSYSHVVIRNIYLFLSHYSLSIVPLYTNIRYNARNINRKNIDVYTAR